MTRLTNLGGNDVDVYGEQAALLYRVRNGRNHGRSVTPWNAGHGISHHVSAFFIGLFELEGVQRRLVVIAAPDVMHATFAADQKLVNIGAGFPTNASEG